MAKIKEKNLNQKPLTLENLIDYSHEVLFPAMEERFATKKGLSDFKNQSLSSSDEIIKKLDILLTEKDVKEYQEEKQRKICAINIKIGRASCRERVY
jgi:hypothetical protein